MSQAFGLLRSFGLFLVDMEVEVDCLLRRFRTRPAVRLNAFEGQRRIGERRHHPGARIRGSGGLYVPTGVCHGKANLVLRMAGEPQCEVVSSRRLVSQHFLRRGSSLCVLGKVNAEDHGAGISQLIGTLL